MQRTRPQYILITSIIALAIASCAGIAVGAAPTVTRADLGWSLLELERAMDQRQLDGPTVRSVNRRFDTAVSYLFTNRYSQAIELINHITRDFQPEEERSPIRDWLMSVAVEIEPRSFTAGEAAQNETGNATVIIRSLYSRLISLEEAGSVELRLIDADGARAWSTTLDIAAHLADGLINARVSIEPSFAELPPGAYRIEAGHPGAAGVRYRRLFVLPRPIDEIRRELLTELDELDDADSLERAIRIARARAALLTRRPSPLRSAEFLADVHDLQLSLTDEIAALRNGVDPYVMREGDLWRPLATRPNTWPMRVFAPSGLDPSESLPLVIALHGAGGDENMFPDAYGNGLIQRLAMQRRFVIASPLTYPLAGDMSLLSELIEEMQRCYPIDESRVYLIGHSLGAGTVSAALFALPERLAAASCIAGAGRFASPGDDLPYPPVLVIGAEHDFVVPASRVQQQAEAGAKNGLPIEYRLAENWGHVLVVGGVLEEVIDWLLDHRRDDPDRAAGHRR